MQTGKELGLNPMTSLNNIHVIKGRTVISAAMLGAMLKREGYEFVFTEDFSKEDNPDNPQTTVKFIWLSKVLAGERMEATHTVTWNQMAVAGYTSKQNWEKYPKEMMRARCLAYAVRAIAPEVLMGVYTDMEIVDATDDSEHTIDMNEEGDVIVIDAVESNEQ